MTGLEIFLLLLLAAFMAATAGLFYFGLRAGRRILEFQAFYEDTLEEVTMARDIFDTLVTRSTMLTDHPDVQNLQQVMLLILDILERYIKDGSYITAPPAQEEGKE